MKCHILTCDNSNVKKIYTALALLAGAVLFYCWGIGGAIIRRALTDQDRADLRRLIETQGFGVRAACRELGLHRDSAWSWIQRQDWYAAIRARRQSVLPQSKTIKHDGSQISERVLALTEEQMADPDALLEAHGYDPTQWELITATSNVWHQQTASSTTIPLYQSKITAKPLATGWPEIIEHIKSATKPVTVRRERTDTESCLLVALNDIHMGSMKYRDYQDTQDRILDLIDEGHREVVVWLAGDLFDTDNLRGTTAHGTPIADIDMPQAWADLDRLVSPIVHAALKQSRTHVILTRGNHSESMEWAYAQYLKARYPQAHHDDALDYCKAMLLGGAFVGLSHGYGNTKSLAINLSKLYPMLWAQACHHEVLIGHEHKERRESGILLRVMPTRARPNDWSREKGFALEHQALQCLQYGPDGVEAVYYV